MNTLSSAAFAAVMHLLHVHARLEERFSAELGAVHGLALKEALLLMHLQRAPRERLSRVDLAKRLNASPSTITRMTIPLEKLGFVGREADARDARLAYVVLSEAGRQAAANASATLERMSAEVFQDRWTAQEIERLADLLGRMTAGQLGNLV